MLCDLDLPLLFVDSPVMNMRPPLKADRLYMENRIEVQNAVAHMVQRGKKRISFAGDKNHCQSFFERYMAYKDAVEYFGLTEGLSTCAMPSWTAELSGIPVRNHPSVQNDAGCLCLRQ